MKKRFLYFVALLCCAPLFIWNAEAAPTVDELLALDLPYTRSDDVEYCKDVGVSLKMDVYDPKTPEGVLRPALLMIHGGGWAGRDKQSKAFLKLAPAFAKRGMVVFNINYRLAEQAPAPAAVNDAHCAARYIHSHAKEYNVDPDRIAATGNSAGCHLALMVAMCQSKLCSGNGSWPDASNALKAVVNRFAITDAYERAFIGKGKQSALRWLDIKDGDPQEMARKMSPVNYTDVTDLPPVLTIHGEADKNTPVIQGKRLHAGLLEHGHISELMIVPGGDHGLHNVGPKMDAEIEKRTFTFLLQQGVF